MIGLVLITGLVAIGVIALIASAVGRHLLDGDVIDLREPEPGRSTGLTGTPPAGPPAPPRSAPRAHPHDAPAGSHDPATPAPPAAHGVSPPPHPASGDDRHDRPGNGDIEPLHHRASLSLKARLAFVYSPKPGCVVLDCTLVEFDDDTDDVVPPGTPFTLELSLPETAWFATSLELLLEQWASECRIVEIALLASDGHAKAHVGDGASRLMLDVDSAAGLSVG